MRSCARSLLPWLLLAACGGNVVVDPGGGISSGGATTTSGSSGTTATDALCVTACDAIAAQCPSFASDGGCGASCAKLDPAFKVACPQAYESFLTCIAAHPAELCGTATSCSAAITAFAPCDMTICQQTPSPCQ
jgi:hypothetical protein